jgi:hypothetical protein
MVMIPIDLTSLKHTPADPSKVFLVPGPMHYEQRTVQKTDAGGWQRTDSVGATIEGPWVTMAFELLGPASEKPDDWISEIRSSQDFQRLYHFGSHDGWDFKYISTDVCCAACLAVFKHTELETREMYTGDDYGDLWSDTACPKCGAWDCVNLQYEAPTAASLRLAALSL